MVESTEFLGKLDVKCEREECQHVGRAPRRMELPSAKMKKTVMRRQLGVQCGHRERLLLVI